MGNFTDDIVGQVAKQAGVDPKLAQMVLEKMAPAMTGAMAKNTQTQEGAEKLSDALDKDHDGSVFGDLGSLLGGSGMDKGAKILGHVFGSKTSDVEEAMAKEVGSDKETTTKMMAMLAPLVLGALGKEKKASGMDASTLAGMLGGATKAMSNDGSSKSLLMSVLDFDKDGSVIDDLPKALGMLAMVKNFFGKKG